MQILLFPIVFQNCVNIYEAVHCQLIWNSNLVKLKEKNL